MDVLLKRPFFCPGGYRIRRSNPPNNPVYVPEAYRDVLPKDAVIIEEKVTKEMKAAGIKSEADLYNPAEEAQKAPETLAAAAALYGGDPARASAEAAAAKEQAASKAAAKK